MNNTTLKSRQATYLFLSQTIQGGRVRPGTFIHEFQMPASLFDDMYNQNLINVEYLSKRDIDSSGRSHEPIAYFQFGEDMVTVSFHHIFNREDFRGIVDRYLIIKAYGYYPCKANWVSKMNFDRKIEAVQHVPNREFKTITLKSDL